MENFAVFANGTFWGEFAGATAEEAIQAAADEHGTDGGADGLTAEPVIYSQSDLDAAAVLMDDDIREDMSSNFEAGFDRPDQFIKEYIRRHADAFGGEVFQW